MMESKEKHDRIDRTIMIEYLKAMNISPQIIELVEVLVVDSSAIVVTNNEKRIRFSTKGGVRQKCPLSPYQFIIV